MKKLLGLIVLGTLLVMGIVSAQGPPQPAVPTDPGFLNPNSITGYATKADTTAATMLAAPGGGNRNYVYYASCDNTGATVTAAFIKQASTTLAAVPCVPSAGNNPGVAFNPPLKPPAGVAVTMTAGTSTTTAYFFMSGYVAK